MQLTGHRHQRYPDAFLSAFGITATQLPQVADACLRSPRKKQGYASLYREIETGPVRFAVRSKGTAFDEEGKITRSLPFSLEVSGRGPRWRLRVRKGPAGNLPAQCAVASPYVSEARYGREIAVLLPGNDRVPGILPEDDITAEMTLAAESLRPLEGGPGEEPRAVPRMVPDPGRPSEQDLSGGLGLAEVTGRIEGVRICPPAEQEGIALDETILLSAQTVCGPLLITLAGSRWPAEKRRALKPGTSFEARGWLIGYCGGGTQGSLPRYAQDDILRLFAQAVATNRVERVLYALDPQCVFVEDGHVRARGAAGVLMRLLAVHLCPRLPVRNTPWFEGHPVLGPSILIKKGTGQDAVLYARVRLVMNEKTRRVSAVKLTTLEGGAPRASRSRPAIPGQDRPEEGRARHRASRMLRKWGEWDLSLLMKKCRDSAVSGLQQEQGRGPGGEEPPGQPRRSSRSWAVWRNPGRPEPAPLDERELALREDFGGAFPGAVNAGLEGLFMRP